MNVARFRRDWRALAARAAGWGRPGPAAARRLEALGRQKGFTGPVLALGAHLWAARAPLEAFGSREQLSRFRRALREGRLLASAAVSEPGAGSDVLSISTLARPEAGRWRLKGRKAFVTGAPAADLLLVWARTAPGRRADALTCFLTPVRTPGVRVWPALWRVGPANAWAGEVALDCSLEDRLRLGEVGQGLAVFHYAMDVERRLILAPALGAMSRRLELTERRVRERRQFGRPLSRTPAVVRRLAAMRRRLEDARRAVYAAAAERPGLARALSARAKTVVSEAWLANALDAAMLGGAKACLTDEALAREILAAASSRLLSGSNDVLARLQ